MPKPERHELAERPIKTPNSTRRLAASTHTEWSPSRTLFCCHEGTALLPPLHDFGAHIYESGLRFAFGEEVDGLDSLVDVILGQSSRLLKATARCYNVTRLKVIRDEDKSNTVI